MFDTNALRQRARELHGHLRKTIAEDAAPMPTAEQILTAAAKETGVERTAVRPGDPLLAGAHAVLNRDYPIVYYAQGAGVSPEQQRFAQAHEYAHYWLHPDLDYDACLTADDGQMLLSLEQRTPDRQLETGYGPAERRESEANLFAAELLLPAPALREAFLEHGWRADRIAAHTGLTETCILTQLASALLLPLPIESKSETTNPPSSPRPPSPEASGRRGSQKINWSADGLDDSQRAAAHWTGGPLLVEAGPGTGKTRTLVAHIVFLLTERSIAPENILALTFSNKAAAEMRSRLRSAIGEAADRVWIGTFHAFGCEILRKDGGSIGLPAKPKLLERADAVSLLAEHLERLPLDQFEYLSNPTYAFPAILNCISRAKSELVTPDDYRRLAEQQSAAFEEASAIIVSPANAKGGKAPTQKEVDEAEKQRSAPLKSLEIAAVYAVYQRLLHERGLLDYGDMLMRAVELLEAFPEVCERWRSAYPYVLADEYQDINRASGRLLQKIAGNALEKTLAASISSTEDKEAGGNNSSQNAVGGVGSSDKEPVQNGLNGSGGLWAVGDPRQAIYRFMGASPANLREFERDFPGGARLSLERNYRSQAAVVALFGNFATQMPGASGQFADWYAERTKTDGAPTITLAIADDEAAQADGIAAELRSREQAGVPLTDQAILCRTNRQASDLAALLEAHGIPTQHLGDLWERVEIKDLLAVLSLACEPEGTTLGRVAAFPHYAVPQADVLALLHHARAADCPFPKALSLIETEIEMETGALLELSETGRAGLQKMWSDLKPLCYRGDAWRLLSRYLFTTSDYLLPLLTDDSAAAQQKKAAIHQLLQSALGIAPRFESQNRLQPQDAQAAFLTHLRHLLACREARSILSSDSAAVWYGVPLMTVHQSKGLEFPVVFLPSLIQGQFPPRKQGSQAVVPPGLATGTGTDGADAEESDEDETGEECLFFVALSRARDALILCQPLNWNGKTAKPSPLLEKLSGTLKAVGTQEVVWHSQRTGENASAFAAESDDSLVINSKIDAHSSPQTSSSKASGNRGSEKNGIYPEEAEALRSSSAAGKNGSANKAENAEGGERELTLSASAVELYQKCPRRYYYSRVLKLPERGERSPYLAFHNSLYETIGWLQAEIMEGKPPTLANTNVYMGAEMARHGDLLTGPHGRVLRDRAEFMLAGAYRRTKDAHDLCQSLPLIAHLPNGNIQLKCDQLEQTGNGSLRLIDYTLSRPKSDDHTKPRLALLRHAAAQQSPDNPTQIFIGYLRPSAQSELEELKEVEESKRYEPARVDKYDVALQGIRAENFDPNPSQECSVCPYFILCPA